MPDRPIWITLTPHADDRGRVIETYRSSWFDGVPPVLQAVQSDSGPGVMRGMHAHRLQWDIWHFTAGDAFVQLYDHRDNWHDSLWVGAGATVAIPPGVSHGFYTARGCTLLYLLTREYDGSDEYGWNAMDETWPGAALWTNRLPEISVRDLTAPSLQEFVENW